MSLDHTKDSSVDFSGLQRAADDICETVDKLRAERKRMRDALYHLERCVSALHSRDLGPAVAPQFRDLHECVLKARELLTDEERV